MKLLITGSGGQVGHALVSRAASAGVESLGLDRNKLDIADRTAVERALVRAMPDIVVNAAAYTAVDRAEEEPEMAFRVNRDGAQNLAQACATAAVPLLHLSTDYVFDGLNSGPYLESDATNPTSIYAKSKWEGEEAVRTSLVQHIIVRTSWVFSSRKSNFVRSILALALERDELCVVEDQTGCPTSAMDVADALFVIATKIKEGRSDWGVYHFAGRPPVTWFAFASAILEEIRRQGVKESASVIPIQTEDYPTKATRPTNSVLSTDKIRETFGILSPDWRDALPRTIEAILAGERV